jgi:hypothetical protein
MAITTYTELQASVADWLNRSDLTSVIPDFIALAEAEFNTRLRHWRGETSGSLALSSQFTALPSDFLEVSRLTLSSATPRRMELMSTSEMQELRERNDDTGGAPIYYAITAGQVEVYPSPDQAYTAALVYHAAPDALSGGNADNWVLLNFPSLYLFGACYHGSLYLQDEQRTTYFGGLFEKSLAEVIRDGERGKYGGAGLRMKVGAY